jgi:tetratricopeptide (TPR) repeat protein
MKKLVVYLLGLFLAFLVGTVYGNEQQSHCSMLLKKAEDERVIFNYAKALEYLTEAKLLAEQNGWMDIKGQAISQMGYVYVNIMDYDKAIDYFIESYNIAIELSDKKRESIALNNIALACYEGGKIEKSMDYFESAYKIVLDLNDSLGMVQEAINLVTLSNMMRNIPHAEKYLAIAHNILYNMNDELELIHLHFAELGTLILKEDYDKAEQLGLHILDQMQTLEYSYEKWKNKGYGNIVPELLINLSAIYEKKNNFEKAVSFAQEALHNTPSLQDEINAYEQLANLYRKNHAFDSALLYMDTALMKKDSLQKVINNSNLESSRIRFDMLNLEKELAQNKAKQRADRILFIVICVGIFIFLFISFLIFRLRAIKNKQQKILELEKEKNEKLLLEKQLKENETLALIEQGRLTNEIENKNKRLIAETLFQSNRDKLLKELIEACSADTLLSKNPLLDSIIKRLRRQLKDTADVNNFLYQFEQINPSLHMLIKEQYPDLSIDDIQLLSYIYVERGDIKKIAHLLNISVEASQKRKERLAVKMSIKTADLYNHLLNIMRSSIFKELSRDDSSL